PIKCIFILLLYSFACILVTKHGKKAQHHVKNRTKDTNYTKITPKPRNFPRKRIAKNGKMVYTSSIVKYYTKGIVEE
ncbi:MAG: hypothetical protein K2L51_03930, partial [Clostridiales bacterium]|nr:hypothetical protein [Clostridiales bacterium]